MEKLWIENCRVYSAYSQTETLVKTMQAENSLYSVMLEKRLRMTLDMFHEAFKDVTGIKEYQERVVTNQWFRLIEGRIVYSIFIEHGTWKDLQFHEIGFGSNPILLTQAHFALQKLLSKISSALDNKVRKFKGS